VHKKHRDCKGTTLGADLEELITRNPGRPMWSLAKEINISRNNGRTMVTEDLRYTLKKLILNMFLCQFIFILIKRDDFQQCCVIF
jgi:hypothetical protein